MIGSTNSFQTIACYSTADKCKNSEGVSASSRLVKDITEMLIGYGRSRLSLIVIGDSPSKCSAMSAPMHTFGRVEVSPARIQRFRQS